MSTKGLPSTISLFYGALLMTVLNPAGVSTTLCESRCENAVPHLRRLKTLWHQFSKREGEDDMSFTHFIQTLIYASRRNSKLSPLKKDLVQMVFAYKDCVKACEHQHSKRNGKQSALRWPSPLLWVPTMMKSTDDKATTPNGHDVYCKKLLITANATLLPISLGTVGLGLVIKFGTFLLEDHIQSLVGGLMTSLNIVGDEDIDVGSYDIPSIISGLGIWFMVLGFASSAIAVIGIMAGKVDIYQIGLIYCFLLGVVILSQIGLVLIIIISRDLIDNAIKPGMQTRLREGYDGFNGTDSFTQSWNLVMLTMKCCGLEGYHDFDKSTLWNRRMFQDGWWFTMATPLLCCKLDVKLAGDFSCAVNPSPVSSNYQRGCYDEVWTLVGDHKVYLLMVGALLLVVQLALFISAIVHTKAVYSKAQNLKNGHENGLKSSKRVNGNKSIADLISSTTGILTQTSSPDVSPDVRNLLDQGLAGNIFASANSGNGTNRSQPFMPFMGNFGQPPMSPLNQLLQQYCLQGRFSNPADPFNPLNIFSTAFFNPYSHSGRVPENPRFDDMCGLLQQQNVPGNQMVLPFLGRFPRFERLGSQFSMQGVPGIENGSPDSLRRDNGRVRELYHNEAECGLDRRRVLEMYHNEPDCGFENRDKTGSYTESRERTSSRTD